ncbi:DDE-type integrase/transposase/recombinase [Tranquillimonas rosea]|uniref:DDE-type integrase/transposase/recombinase n=1 Tax=Tranquillimonas rosea TaxID=641238 RepID=UPI003BA9ACB3
MRRGFLYLVAIMDWHSRRALSWRLSNTLEAEFCAEALDEAIARFGPPEIMNTDQGSQGGLNRSSQHGQFQHSRGSRPVPLPGFSSRVFCEVAR